MTVRHSTMDTCIGLVVLLCTIWISQVTSNSTVATWSPTTPHNFTTQTNTSLRTQVTSSVTTISPTTTQANVTYDIRTVTRESTTTTTKPCEGDNGWMYSTVALGVCFGVLAIMFTVVVIVFLVRASGGRCSCGELGTCTKQCCWPLSIRLPRSSRHSESTAVMLSRQSVQSEALSRKSVTSVSNDESVIVMTPLPENVGKEKKKSDAQRNDKHSGKTGERKSANSSRSSDGNKSQTVNSPARAESHKYGNTNADDDDDVDEDDGENIYELPAQEVVRQVGDAGGYVNSPLARNSKDESEDDDESTGQMYCAMSTGDDHTVSVHLGEDHVEDSEEIYVNY